jgi:hypothetical protein|tara:strand:- start:75 stop:566 length:492 start_codon:yes stop_codon:yes gene_type:complete
MDPLTLLALGSNLYNVVQNYQQRPQFMQGPMGAGIAALQGLGGAIPYAVNPVAGGINSLLGLADEFTGTNLPDFSGDVLNPIVQKLNERQFDNFFEKMRPLPEMVGMPTPQPQPTFNPGPPDRQTRSGGGNPYTMSNFSAQLAPQKVQINAPAFKGMGYTRGR